VLCPLAREAALLQRTLQRLDVSPMPAIRVTGPGTAGVDRWFSDNRPDDGTCIILAGLAGGLSRNAVAGTAWWVHRVIDARSRAVRDSPVPASLDCHEAPAVVVSTATVCTTDAEKRTLADAFNADLVDMESAAFAAHAAALNVRWMIVRGVSDGPDTSLPASIGTWVDAEGQVRPGRIAMGLLRRPWLLGSLRRLDIASNAAMEAVACRITDLVRTAAWDRGTTD
jgi:hypothetical protein